MIARATPRLPAKERRKKILDGALAVFSKLGYAGLTTARVAERAGISEPILYRHFSSKRAILRALLDDVVARMLANFQRETKGEIEPVAALRRVCLVYPRLTRRYSREFSIINQALAQCGDSTTQKLLSAHYLSYHDFLQRLIEKGQQAGSLRKDVSADVGAWHIVHSAMGLLMMQKLRAEPDSEQFFQKLTEAALGGLMKCE